MDKELHETLREKIRRAYTQIPSQGVYFNSRSAMQFTFKGADDTIHRLYLDPVGSSAIVNALVPKSGLIYRGGHGGGKTTLIEKVTHMLTSIPEDEIISAMIRGNDDQNVNTILASLKLGKLMHEGSEEVVWRKFVKCYVKIIDEVNRFPPPVQNALFEILNKGRVEFIDNVYPETGGMDFVAYATENPNDTGTYPLSKPFLDRFSFCVPAPQIPSASDQYLLAERPDDKLIGVKVEPVMKLEELKEARRIVSEDVHLSSDALIYAIYLTQAVSSCDRGDFNDKSHNELAVGDRCKGCGYDTTVSICAMTKTGLSGRAFLDFQRWGKGYAWFLNAFENPEKPEVQLETIETIAPYLMYHRVEPSEMVLGRDPFFGKKMSFYEDLVKKATQGYNTVKDALKDVPKVLRGDKQPRKSDIYKVDKDLVIKTHFQPLIEDAANTEFREIYEQIETQEIKPQTLQNLQLRLAFETELKLPAQTYLLSKALAKVNKEDFI